MRRSLCGLVLALAALTACGGGGDGGSGPKVSLAGTYNLSTVDSHTIPYILYDDGTLKVEAVRGTFTIATGTYTENVTLRFTDSSGTEEVPAVCSGTYTNTGNSLTLTETESADCSGGNWGATWDGRNTITVNYGLQVVYKR